MIEQTFSTERLTTHNQLEKQDEANFNAWLLKQLALFLWFSSYPDRDYLLSVREHKNNEGETEASRPCYILRLLLRMLGHSFRGWDVVLLANGETLDTQGRLLSLTSYIAGRKELLATNQRGISKEERDVVTQLNIAQLLVENLNSEGVDLDDYNAFTKRFPDPKLISN